MLWWTLFCLWHHPAILVLVLGISDGLGKHGPHSGRHRPPCCSQWYQDEILRAIVRPAADPGFLSVLHLARVCRQYLDDEGIDATDWPKSSWAPDDNAKYHHRLLGAHWCPDPSLGGDPQDTNCWLIRSMPRRQVCLRAHSGHTHYWVTLWVAVIKIQVGSACDFNFRFDFSIFWIQPSVGCWFWFPMTVSLLFRNYTQYTGKDFQLK